MMRALNVIFLALGSLISSAYGQTAAPTNPNGALVNGVANWNLYRAITPEITVYIQSIVPDTTPNARTVTLNVFLESPESNVFNMIDGFSLNIGPSTLFCAPGNVSDTCLVEPTVANADLYPTSENVSFFSIAFKKLLFSFTNTDTVEGVSFCASSLLENFCSTRQSCEQWNSTHDYAQEYVAAIQNQLTNPVTPTTVTNVVKTIIASGRQRKYTLDFSVENVPNDMFGTDIWGLGLGNGKQVFVGFGLWYSNIITGACSTAVHNAIFSREPDQFTSIPNTPNRFDQFSGNFVEVTTLSPTTSPPTVEIICPNDVNWSTCWNINFWYKQYEQDPEKRNELIGRACREPEYNCYYCGYATLPSDSYQCRPKLAGEAPNEFNRSFTDTCPLSSPALPWGTCELFTECPDPSYMTACKALNFEGGYNAVRCETGFITYYTDAQGETTAFTAPRHVCAYNNGICRAVGQYFYAKELIFNLPGLFDKDLDCPYSTVLPPLSSRGP